VVVPESVALALTVAVIVAVTVSVTLLIDVAWLSVADMLPWVADPSVALVGPPGSPLVGAPWVVPVPLSVAPLLLPPTSSPQPTPNTTPHPTIHLLYPMDR